MCQTQWSYVTFVNGEWQGTIDYRSGNTDAAQASCPHVWEYVNRAGREGWEIVGVMPLTLVHTPSTGMIQASNQLFLKRAID